MNIHASDITADTPTREEAARALETLRAWAGAATAEERAALGMESVAYPAMSRRYDAGFVADEAYRATLPDLQNGPESLIKGARRRIQHVGISNFRLPLAFARGDGGSVMLDTSVTGSVSLEAEKKGINMSRIMRSFYAEAETGGRTGPDVAEAVLDAYKRDLGSLDARLMLRASVPLEVAALRSGLTGWQYYDVAWEVAEQEGTRLRALHLDYVYSSTCPCSLELSEHARRERGQLATPHSQRSVARLSMALDPDAFPMAVEDAVELCRGAVPTETQVMVKREDEQAFAELNAANPIFVEDAARLFAEALMADVRVGDFRVVASHQESLHSHDAVSVLTEGDTFAGASVEPHLFGSLIHRG
ncbi:GTP cyclohydrolase I FolE2 [Rhodovulum sp. 12E13]|uniref:GTP cyclohydrolase FolE2 n=1 Tax=Rhodovulum sp. 12E13 TaxID=2203891 RepID=UPI000E1A8B2D|nr:GTP cyclohydrolase FolE2 [Rhodovulum sp. 12E13]RDC72063.1 GTP cyclohydrolase I FolE2 [Rhodovulum sp. 12E13]